MTASAGELADICTEAVADVFVAGLVADESAGGVGGGVETR